MIGPLEKRCRAAAEQCAWLLLGSMGMSSASQRRARHSVSPEDALLVAAIGSDLDHRLRDEARDWFLEFDDLISRPALKHRVGNLVGASRESWASFVSPLRQHARGIIPGAEPSSAGKGFVRSGKSRRVITSDVAYGVLRCRAAFGTQARADVLFLLATTPNSVQGWMADAVAHSTGYTKSAVREALDRLVEAGIVRRTRVGNADWFALTAPNHIAALVGPIAAPTINTNRIPRVLSVLLQAAAMLDKDDDPTAFVPARNILESVDRDLGDLRTQLPLPTHNFEAGRNELIKMITALADKIGDPSRTRWPC